MEQWEKELYQHNLQKAIAIEAITDSSNIPFEEIVKGNKHYFSPKEREKLAEKDQALPDGSFPIRNVQDLKDAIRSWGRAKDKERAKRWIKRRAKELGKEDLLPETWKDGEDQDEEKAIEDILEKARSGVYKDIPENRKLGRVGQRYGSKKMEEEKVGKKKKASSEEEKKLLEAAKSKDPEVRLAAMNNPKATPEILKIGAQDEDSEVRRFAMWNPNATPEILKMGVKSKDWQVRWYVMNNPNATPEILKIGIEDRKGDVRAAVMGNPNTPEEMLRQGAKDEDWAIRRAVMQNPKAPRDILLIGVQDDEKLVRHTAEERLKELESKKTLQKAFDAGLISEEIFNKARSGVYKDIPENRKLGRVGQKYGDEKKTKKEVEGWQSRLDKLGLGDDEEVINHVKALIRSGSPVHHAVSIAVKEKKKAGEKLLEDAKNKDPEVRQSAMYDPKATPEILKIGAKDRNYRVRRAAMHNRNATPEILKIGAQDKEWVVRREVMQHPNATEEMLRQGVKDPEWRVRREVMDNPNTPEEILKLGAKDESEYVRVVAMNNPNVTEEILKIGIRDENEYVRKFAEKKLKELESRKH